MIFNMATGPLRTWHAPNWSRQDEWTNELCTQRSIRSSKNMHKLKSTISELYLS